jgi:hypothetical protein
MKLKDVLKEGMDLIGKSKDMISDLADGRLEDTIEFVVQGNQGGEHVYKHIVDTLDTTKKNYGKRGSNLISFVGGVVISEEYGVNVNQAQSIWKKLGKENQAKFDGLIKSQLEQLEKELAE